MTEVATIAYLKFSPINIRSLIKLSWWVDELLADYFFIYYDFSTKMSSEWINSKRHRVDYNQKNTYKESSIRIFFYKLFKHYYNLYCRW